MTVHELGHSNTMKLPHTLEYDQHQLSCLQPNDRPKIGDIDETAAVGCQDATTADHTIFHEATPLPESLLPRSICGPAAALHVPVTEPLLLLQERCGRCPTACGCLSGSHYFVNGSTAVVLLLCAAPHAAADAEMTGDCPTPVAVYGVLFVLLGTGHCGGAARKAA